MDPAYDALEAATSSYKSRSGEGGDRSRSHRDDRDRSDRGDRDRDHDRDRDRERRHRDYDRDDRRRDDRDRGDRRDRDRDYDRHDRRDRDRDYDRHDDRRRDDRGGRRDDPYGRDREYGGRDRSPPRRRYDDRGDRGGGGGRDDWRGGRGGGGGGGGRRRDSPQRSPTPVDAVPLEARSVEPSLWDIAPPQFEGISALEAKMTGMFTYGPGRVAPPLHLGLPSSFAAGMINPLRQKQRVYVTDLAEGMTDRQVIDHFNKVMEERGLTTEPGKAVTMCEVNKEKLFAYLEMRSPEEAASALELDGTELDGTVLHVKRPKDMVGIDPALGFMGVTGDANNKLFVGGLPTNLTSDQVMELLKSFGELRTFNLVKEGNGTVSKGFAFVEYLDPTVTDMAIQGLNGFQLGDRSLVVQRAATTGRSSATAPTVAGTAAFLATSSILQAQEEDAPASRVMLMLNMVTPDELYDDRDYAEILDDIRDECSKFGEVEGVRIPRPVPKSTKWEPSDSAAQTAEKNRKLDEENGVGRVYVMYADIDSCTKAMKALGGRQFGGRTILVANVSEEDFLGPAPLPPPSPPPAPEEGSGNPYDEDQPPPPPPPGPPPPAAVPPAPVQSVEDEANDLLNDIAAGLV